MSEKQDIKIHFFKKMNIWRFYLEHGKYQSIGTSRTFRGIKKKAFEVANNIPSSGIIHITYDKNRKTKDGLNL